MLTNGPNKLLPQDPTEHFSNEVTKICNKLLLHKQITQDEYDRLIIKESRSPILYGSPKIHKDNCPLRPVVDFRKSPTYELAKFLSNILKPLTRNYQYTIKNSKQFVDEIKKIKIRPVEVKASFDVKSLFTNVPISRTLEYINNQLKEKYPTSNKLKRKSIMELLKICMSSTYFKYEDQFYQQNDGTAMGSPISAIVAELCLEMLELECVQDN